MNVFWVILAGLAGLALLTLAYVGLLYLTRSVHVRKVRAPGGDTAKPGDDEFPPLVSMLTRAELKDGHKVDLLTCGNETYPALWKDLRCARRSITAQMYYAKPGRMADEFADILVERAKAGVKVLFLRDGFGSQSLPKNYLQRLEDAGIVLATFRPARWYELHKVHHRSHIRVVVVDGQIGYTGGFGLDDKWFGDGRHEDQWRDTTVRFEGPSVMQLQGTFAAGWAEATGELITEAIFFPEDGFESEGPYCAGLLHAAPTVGSTAAERYLILAIGDARRSVYITNAYFVPTNEFRNLLCETAARGVDVRILTPGKNSDVKSTYYAGRLQVEQLLRSGVKLYEYTASMLHAKSTVTDRLWSGAGSLNFDNRSLAFNDETVLFVHDAKFGAKMHALFEADLEYAAEVTLEKHLARPYRQRVLEQMFGLFYRLL